MKIKEAKEIIAYINEWQFVLMGVKERYEIEKKMDLSKYTLLDIIKANKLIETHNNLKRKMAEFHRKQGHKVNPYSQQMILSDRLIAAVYTALNFEPNGEMIALINDRAIGCVKPDYNN